MLTFNNSVVFEKDKPSVVLLRNFYQPEGGFVWATSRWCEIVFACAEKPPRAESQVDLVLDMDVFKMPPDFNGQSVLVYLNGLRIGSLDVERRGTMLVPFNSSLLKAEENVLTFDTPDVASPRQFGLDDDRKLSVQLFSLQLRPGD